MKTSFIGLYFCGKNIMMDRNIADSLTIYEHKRFGEDRRCMHLLYRCQNMWDALRPFRKMRERCKNYYLKDQWCDDVVYNGRRMSESQYIKEQGLPALQNNLIGKSVRTILGLRRQANNVPVCTAVDSEEAHLGDVMSELLKQNMSLNHRKELDSRQFEEFCMSGLVIYKSVWSHRNGHDDVFTDAVNPNFCFFEQGTDVNMNDLDVIGQIHNVSFGDILESFSGSDADDRKLEEIYAMCSDATVLGQQLSNTLVDNVDINNLSFFYPNKTGKCRVIEVWTKERRKAWWCHDRLQADSYMIPYNQIDKIKQENQRRIEANIIRDVTGEVVLDATGNPTTYVPQDDLELIEYERRIEQFWYYRFLSPLGHVLEEGVSPYKSAGEYMHPYTIKPYPYIDGEIHSFVNNIIDQQRFVNHYVIMMDFLMKNAAKGVIAVDKSSLGDDFNIEDIRSEYVKTNGIILYNSHKGQSQMPAALQSAQVPVGIEFMINLQKSFVEEVSGVQPALQGKSVGSAASGYMYQQQVTQSTATVYDLIDTYNSFLRDVAMKNIKIMQQYYNERKCIVISGDKMFFDPMRMGGAEYDIAISDSTDTPVYRAMNNELLMQLLQMKMVGIDTVLKMGSFPNSDKLLQLVQQERQQMQEQQAQLQAQQTGQAPQETVNQPNQEQYAEQN